MRYFSFIVLNLKITNSIINIDNFCLIHIPEPVKINKKKQQEINAEIRKLNIYITNCISTFKVKDPFK